MFESLTPAQRRLFTQHLLNPGDASYNLAFLFRVEKTIDVERIILAGKRLLNDVVPLSMSYVMPEGGNPPRVIQNPDLSHEIPVLPMPAGGEDALVAEVSRAADTPIPPDRPPLIATRLYMGARAMYASILISHLIADAYTFYAFSRRLRELYDDPTVPIPEAATTPACSAGERPAMTNEAIEHFRRLAYGQRLCPVRFDGLRDESGVIPGAHTVVDLGRLDRCVAWAESRGVTMASMFLAAHVLLQQALTGETVIAVGIPQTGRQGMRQRQAFGCYVNTLPLVVEPHRYPDVVSLCQDIQTELMSLIRYQLFDLTAHATEVLGSPGGATFGSSFTYYREPLTLRLSGVTIERLPLRRRQICYPLALNVERGPNQVLAHLEYADALAPAEPERLLRTLLDQVLSEDCPPPSAIRAVSPRHERELTALCAGRRGHRIPDPRDRRTAADQPGQPTLPGAVLAVALAHPDRLAVSDSEGSWTYADLIDHSRRVAGVVTRQVAGDHVVVSLPQGRAAVAAILGVVMAGKTYVPVEPDCPPQRLAQVLSDVGNAPMISQNSRLAQEIDSQPLGAGPAPRLPAARAHAYVIFTSGSTGRPKGVQVTHRNVLRLFGACDRRMALDATDTWALFHSLAFDLSVWEIFGALLHGAHLAVASAAVRRDPLAFGEFLAKAGVTVLTQTPSALRRLSGVLTAELASQLRVRHVVLAGEPLHPAMLRRWFELLGDRAEIANMYGITETTIHVTHHVVTPEEVDDPGPANVGRPLPGWDITLVDAWNRPCPVGTPGEIVVGGVGVSDGYLARPELTLERFGVDGSRGTRFYRSGDLGVLRPSGELVHLGRMDRQIQLRGYRVEPGEIEAALSGIPGVREAVVVCDDRPTIEPRLVAFVTGDPDRIPSDDLIRRELRLALPAHMIPTVLIRLSEIPLTANGKTNFQALPLPPLRPVASGNGSAVPGGQGPDPEDDVLRLVAGMLCEVLSVPEVEPNHNFFDIGGTSMHVVALHRRLSEQFDVDLDITELFEYTTVRALADRLRKAGIR